MFYMIMFFLNLMNSTLILFMKHPLAMGMTLLIQTILICLTSNLKMSTFWFSYILFLIFLGGLLVLFIYISSLASNEMFKFSSFFMICMMFFTFLIFCLMIVFDKNYFLMNFLSMENLNFKMKNLYFKEETIMLNKLFNFPVNFFSILLMMYLFLTLIAAVKISNIMEGPLRSKF